MDSRVRGGSRSMDYWIKKVMDSLDHEIWWIQWIKISG
jgi:hypothetical protein